METVYKVCRQGEKEDAFYSSFANSYGPAVDDPEGIRIRYELNKESVPTISFAPLFAFDSAEAAKSFAIGIANPVVFRCSAKRYEGPPPVFLAAVFETDAAKVKEAWDPEKPIKMSPDLLGKAVILCDSITLLERVA